MQHLSICCTLQVTKKPKNAALHITIGEQVIVIALVWNCVGTLDWMSNRTIFVTPVTIYITGVGSKLKVGGLELSAREMCTCPFHGKRGTYAVTEPNDRWAYHIRYTNKEQYCTDIIVTYG